MLRDPKGARRYNDQVTLTYSVKTVDDFGHTSYAAPSDVLTLWAEVRQMSATKSMMTFQQANIVGLDVEFRAPSVTYNGLRWKGHNVHFPTPEDVNNRGRVVRISGWYQIDE